MTRADFLEHVRDFYDLVNFCSEENCYVCEDIIDDEYRDERINDDLYESIRYGDINWYDIAGLLEDIPTGYTHYRTGYGSFEYFGLDDSDFDDYYHEVLTWADENEVWDEEDEEVEDEDPGFDVSDFKVSDIISGCCEDFNKSSSDQDDNNLPDFIVDMGAMMYGTA